jgi:hypothetical protein
MTTRPLRPAALALAVLAGEGLAPLLQATEARLAARLVTLAGVVATGIVAIHAIDPPGPSGVMTLGPGLSVALAGAALMVVGGWRGTASAAAAAAFEPFGPLPPVHAGDSVAPPGFGPVSGL